MEITPAGMANLANPAPLKQAPTLRAPAGNGQEQQLRKQFDTFMGEAFYGQMLQALRKSTTGQAAYFHGGKAEETFRAQFDQVVAGKLSEASAERFTGPMFELFQLQQR